ncbi:hypothetical protein [Streptomyces sp. NPDC002067]
MRRAADGAHAVATDRTPAASVPSVRAVGESRGIGGAAAPLAEGEPAGLTATARLGGAAATP